MKKHRNLDALIKGSYAKENGIFKGCAVGCAVQSLNVKRGLHIKHDDHAGIAEASGVPEWLYRLADTLFENLPEPENQDFAVEYLEAIPGGVNLEPVKRDE